MRDNFIQKLQVEEKVRKSGNEFNRMKNTFVNKGDIPKNVKIGQQLVNKVVISFAI